MKKAIALIALLSGSAFAQVQLGRNVEIGAGGTGGCVPSAPANAVLYSPTGTDCAGSSKFTFHPDVSTGQVLINQGAFLEIDGVDSSNFAFLNGDQFILTNHGESNVQTGVAVHVDESAYTGTGLGPLAFDAIFEVDKAGHFGTGFLTEPSIGSVAANTIIGYQSGAPSTSGGTVGKFYGFHAAGAGTNATTEEFSFFAKTAPNASVNSNYCDFMARTQEVSPVLRAKIGCGPTAASMFGGPVTVPDLTVTGTCTGCGGGTPGGSTTQIQYNNAGAFGGDSGFTTDGAGHETMKSLAVADGTGVAGFVGIKQGTAPSTAANSVGFTAPTSVTAYNMKLPAAQGTGALTNDGAGNLSWTAAGGTPGSPSTSVQTNQGGTFTGNANFTWDNTNNILAIGYPKLIPLPTYTITGPIESGPQESTFGAALQHNVAINDTNVLTSNTTGSIAGAFSVYAESHINSAQDAQAITAIQSVYGTASATGVVGGGIALPGAGNTNAEFSVGLLGFGQLGDISVIGTDLGTVPRMASVYAANNTNYGLVSNVPINAGFFSEQQFGGTLNAAFYAMNQGTSAGNWAIYLAGGNSNLGPDKTSGGVFNATTGFQLGGAAPSGHCLLGNGTNYVDSASCSGTVTSVAQTVPSWLAVSGSPVTTTGTLAITAATGQTSHQVLGTCGTATSFAPCALVAGDIPAALSSSTSVNGTSIPASVTLAQTIASGTSALGTSAIASGTCATVVTTSATGTATTDVVPWGFNADPTSTTGYSPTANGMLTIIAYPTANNVNFKVCNNTSASITPGAVTLNWRIAR